MDLAQFGASGAVVVVVIIFLKYMREETTNRDRTYLQVAQALDKLTRATLKNTEATTSADTYLKERNGRDIEKHHELLMATKEIPKTMKKIADEQAHAIIEAVTVKEQHVDHQYVKSSKVDTEFVKHETVA